MEEFKFTPDNETPNVDMSEFSFTPDKDQETVEINPKDYNGTALVADAGEDSKPYSKMQMFLDRLKTFEVRPSENKERKPFSMSGSSIKFMDKTYADQQIQNNLAYQAWQEAKGGEEIEDVNWKEVGKSGIRGLLEIGKGITASQLKIYGDWAMDNRDTSLMSKEEKRKVSQNNFTAKAYYKVGEYLEKMWDLGLNAEWLKQDKKIFEGSFVENPSLTRTLSLGASAIPSIGWFGGIAKATGSRTIASYFLAAADADDIYFGAREKGKSQNEALVAYGLGTAGTAALEKYGFEQIFNQRVTAPLAQRVRTAIMSEGLTEGAQTIWQNMVKKYGYDKTQNLWDGVIESVIGGALSGGAISVADAGYIKLTNARQDLKDQGMSDEALDQLQENIATEIGYHSDTVSPLFQNRIDQSISKLDEFIKANEGTAEAQKALRFKTELEEVYNQVNKSLVDNGVNEEVANADAKVWQGIALFGAEETGLSPMEYFKNVAPRIEKAKYAEYENRRNAQYSKDLDNYIPYQFAGEKAKVAALDKLNEAKRFEKNGIDNEEIRQKTGWFKGADGKWRFEISDKDAKVKLKDVYKQTLKRDFDEQQYVLERFGRFSNEDNPEAKKVQKKVESLKNKMDTLADDTIYKYMQEAGVNYNYSLDDILEHDKLYEAYPELRNVWVKFVKDENDTGGTTTFYPDGSAVIEVNIASDKEAFSYANLKKTLVHEIQHIIQNKEGFAKGNNLEAYNGYIADLRHQFKKYVADLFIKEAKKKFGVKIKYYDALKMIDDVFRGDHENKQYLYDSYKLDRIEFIKHMASKGQEFSDKEDAWRDAKAKDIPTSAYEYYFRTAGEVEARNTETRMDMSDEERMAKSPESTQDVKNEDAFVIFSDGTTLSYMPESIEKTSQVERSIRETKDLINKLDEIKKADEADSKVGDLKAQNEDRNVIEFNVESMNDKESVDYMRKIAKKKYKMTDSEFDALHEYMKNMADTVTQMAKENGHKMFSKWNERSIARFLDEKGNLLPIISAFKTNGDYPLNFDLSSLCTRREATNIVVKHLIDMGYAQQLGSTQLEALKDILRESDFTTACDICFVESKRLRQLTYANTFAYEWESVRMALGLTDDNEVGTPREFTEEQKKILSEMASKDKKVREKAFDKYIPESRKRVYIDGKQIDSGITPDKMKMIASLFEEDSSFAGTFNAEWLLSSYGVDWLMRTYPNTNIRNVLASMYGTATPKPIEGFSIYDPLSWKKVYDVNNNSDKLSKVFAIGGFRGQSFSDFNSLQAFDYFQFFCDLAIRHLPIHMYTKVPSLIKLYGETGAMFNMSLVPEIVTGVDKEHAGLKPDGKGGWEYAWSKDSFPIEDAFALRKDKKYGGRVGTIAVGVSDAHILKMLDDSEIDMVIPFHLSGMPLHTRVKTGLDKAKDYTEFQTTKGAGTKDYNYNEKLQEIGDPRKTAQDYLKWCKENGYTPKFEQFSKHKNYYKLLEDFRGYDNDGNPVLQKAVDVSKIDPKSFSKTLDEVLTEREKEVERQDNIIKEKDVIRKINRLMSKQKIEAEYRTALVSRLKTALGKDNVKSLPQAVFNAQLAHDLVQTKGAKEAKRTAEIFRKNDGVVYGYAKNGIIYMNENVFNANTPAHEFTHIWSNVARQKNPQLWEDGKALLKQSTVWQEVMEDSLYLNIRNDEDAVASEVLSRIVGRENEELIRQAIDPKYKPLKEQSAITKRIMDWFKKLWGEIRSLFDYNRNGKPLTYDEFVHMPLKDLWEETRNVQFNKSLDDLSIESLPQMMLENDDAQFQSAFAGSPKGAYIENLDSKGVIYLFEQADASTFMHETAHFFRKELKSFNTARSQEMLKKMDEWENAEFDKRYNVRQDLNGYVVTDKIGNIVYGAEKAFDTYDRAKEYAKNELFARGFEQYLRDGKAPNNYLKQAFRSFWNWLRHLYKAAKDLNVDLNDDIRQVYGNILGGQDLDFYLSAPVDEVLQQRIKTNEEVEKYMDDEIKKAQAEPLPKTTTWWREKTDSAKGRNTWWNKAVVPISTRAKRVNQSLRNKLRAYDYAVYTKYNNYMAQIKPFLDKWATFEEQDAIAFDLALKNGYVKKQLEIVNKYDAYEDFVAVKNLLNNIFDQAIDLGMELGYTADYFPRQVADVDGFMQYLHGTEFGSQMRRALYDVDPDNVFTAEEKAEFINKYLRGMVRNDLNAPLIGNTKDRRIEVIGAEINKFYKPSMQALISYIDGMNNSLESRRFWGFKHDDIAHSIGALTADLVERGLIKPSDDQEVKEILTARFKAKGVTSKFWKFHRNMSYIYTMGGINSAITQIDDISVALYKAGLWNTVNSIFSKNREGLTREDLGLEKIGQEFMDVSTSSKAVSAVFKMTGLDKIDAFGKNVLINATFDKFQKLANTNEEELRRLIEPTMEMETNQTIEDIKNGVISENVKLLMFNELADMQPISLSEMPEYYLTTGNGRVAYMLKTFALKRIDIFRNECFDKIKNGDTKAGIQNLFRLAILMIACGMSKDAIIDMLYGRNLNLTDMFVNNLLGLTGILTKYSLYKTRDEGFNGFLASQIPPVFAIESDLWGEIYKSIFEKKGKDISDYEVWKGIPLVGRFYYWWFGGGRTKINKKNKKKLK